MLSGILSKESGSSLIDSIVNVTELLADYNSGSNGFDRVDSCFKMLSAALNNVPAKEKETPLVLICAEYNETLVKILHDARRNIALLPHELACIELLKQEPDLFQCVSCYCENHRNKLLLKQNTNSPLMRKIRETLSKLHAAELKFHFADESIAC